MDRIAMISYFAPPLLGAESILVAKTVPELARFYDIDLITVKHDPDFREDLELSMIMGESNLQMYRYANPKPSNKILRRLYERTLAKITDVNAGWIRNATSHHPLDREYQLIYSRSQPGASHLIGYHLKKKLGVPWVAQFSDPWAHNPFHPYPPNVARIAETNEANVIRNADHYIFPTEEIRDLVASYYADTDVVERSTVLPHCYDESLYEIPTVDTSAEHAAKDRFTLTYVGDFYGIRTPEPLLKALQVLQDQSPDIASSLEIRIYGNVENRLRQMMEMYTATLTTPILTMGQVPYRTSLEKMAESDALLLIDAPSDVNLFLPSKLIDYFGSKKPMIGITSERGTTSRLIREYGFSVADPRDPEKIASALRELYERRNQFTSKARENQYERFTNRSVASQLHQIFETIRTE